MCLSLVSPSCHVVHLSGHQAWTGFPTSASSWPTLCKPWSNHATHASSCINFWNKLTRREQCQTSEAVSVFLPTQAKALSGSSRRYTNEYACGKKICGINPFQPSKYDRLNAQTLLMTCVFLCFACQWHRCAFVYDIYGERERERTMHISCIYIYMYTHVKGWSASIIQNLDQYLCEALGYSSKGCS